MILAAQAAVTPAGKLVAAPIPVAPVVVWVISVSAELIHKVGVVEAALTELFALTVTFLITCADNPLQPFAVTWMSTVPENPLAHVITPADDMEPAAALLNDQLNTGVLFVAVVAYVVVVVPLVS